MNGQSPDKIVFDTCTLIHFLKQYTGSPDLPNMFPDADLFISVITEFELLSYWNLSFQEETNINRMLSNLVVIPFTPDVKQQGILFRRAVRSKTPDSIIAATAIILDVALVTHDKDLDKIAFPGFSVLLLK